MTHRFGLAAALAIALWVPTVQAQAASEQGARLFQAGRYREARAALQPQAGTAVGAFWLGRVAFEEARYGDAVSSLEQAVKADGNVADYHAWLGRAYAEQAKRSGRLKQVGLAKKVKSAFERAVALDPRDAEARGALAQFYLVAPSVVGGGAGKAREQAREAMKLSSYVGTMLEASIAEKEGKTAEAERLWRGLTRQYPDSALPLGRLSTLLQSLGRHADAFALLDARLRVAPRDLEALYQLGRGAGESGTRLADGERALRAALAATPKPGSPSETRLQYRLGQVLERAGKQGDARVAYEAAVRADGGNDEARKALSRVR